MPGTRPGMTEENCRYQPPVVVSQAPPPLLFERRGVRLVPFSVARREMERREAPGACETPYGPCEGPLRAPIKAGLRRLPWDSNPSANGAAPPGAPPQTSLRSLRTLDCPGRCRIF